MNSQTLTNRVEILGRKVEGLAELPDRVGALELQVSQLRTEMGVEFSAVRAEMRELNDDTRGELGGRIEALRTEMRELNEASRRELGGRIEDVATHMHVLHEEVISRIALLDEHTNGPRSTRQSPARRPREKRKPKR